MTIAVDQIVKHNYKCGKYAPMVTHKTTQCLVEAEHVDPFNFVVFIYYCDSSRRPLLYDFRDAMEEAIDIARLYSQDMEVLNTYVQIGAIRVATFAGFWMGRKYDNS